MTYQKQTWNNYNDSLSVEQNKANKALVTAEGLNHIETGIEQVEFSLNQQLADIVKTIDVKSYGAKGDGVSDDTPIIQELLNFAKTLGSVKLRFPKGTYLVKSLELHANTSLFFDGGATLLKFRGITSAWILNGPKSGTVGGGYTGRGNIYIEGATFDGNRREGDPEGDYIDSCFGLSHGENITIKNCTFIDAASGDHVFDVGGCRNVLIDNCRFLGTHGLTGMDRTEVIQIDVATSSAFPHFGPFDNTVCENITITRCLFTKNTGNERSRSRVAIGTHNYATHKNINIEGNTFDKCHYRSISFFENDVLNIIGNTFIQDESSEYTGIYLQLIYNIKINDNKFIGYDKSWSVELRGSSARKNENVEICRNDIGLVFILYAKNVKIEKNKSNATRFLWIERIKNGVVKDNDVSDCTELSLRIRECEKLSIENNSFSNSFMLSINSWKTDEVTIANNTFANTNIDVAWGSNKHSYSIVGNVFNNSTLKCGVLNGLVISGNTFKDTDVSKSEVIIIVASVSSMVVNNTFLNINKGVYYAGYSTSLPQNIIFKNNVMTNLKTGDMLRFVADPINSAIIEGNTFENGPSRVFINSNGENFIVRNNIFRDLMHNYIELNYDHNGSEICDNIFVNTGTATLPPYFISVHDPAYNVFTSNNSFDGTPTHGFINNGIDLSKKGDGVWIYKNKSLQRFRLEIDENNALKVREVL